MIAKIMKPRKALNKAYLRVKPNRAEIQSYKINLIQLLDRTNDKETEEFHKNLVIDFLKKTYYDPDYFINTKGRNDLVIHNGDNANSSVGVIIEAKSPSNKNEMVTPEKLNVKGFHELVLYYLRERVTLNNLAIKHLIVTNINEWLVFDATIFETYFAQNKKLVKQFSDFESGRLADSKTVFFYKNIAEPFIAEIESEIEFTYFNLQDYEKPLRNEDKADDKKLIALFKLLSPEHLLKLPFKNDSNSLDKRFYSELLHIIGLAETKEGSKKIIGRKKKGERHTGSILEDTIIQLDGSDKISRIKNSSLHGSNLQEKLFNVALELCITWINRILFLKLLEAQLINYNKGDKSLSFLNYVKIKNYDDLNSLFFQVLDRKYDDRNEDVVKAFANVPYLNSSLFEPAQLEQDTLFISNLKDDKSIPIIASTVLKDRRGKKRSGNINTLEYLFEFLNAYDFSSEGSEEIQEENKSLINASVLGLIFEKINGYRDGSFFTPGFITMYMCGETIRKAVVDKFNELKGWDCKDLEELYDNIEDRQEANLILNSLKICDPAVGSGHYLVSALNELVAIKNDLKILQDRNGRRLKEYQVEVVNDELIVTDEEGELFEYNPNSAESQRIQETLFHEKQIIIERCLFGVDINPNSVKICRLRLWIELLKSAYYKNKIELETLPNIDINIKCGNSLVSRFDIESDMKAALKKSKWSIDSYKTAVDSYRNARSKEQKREMEQLITDIKSDFRSEILSGDPKVKKLSGLKNELSYFVSQGQLFEMSKKEKAIQSKKIKGLSASAKKLEAEIEAIKANVIYDNAFEWRFEFPEVLNDDGEFVGFDVVIGNPPYGISFSDLEKEYLKLEYEYLVERIRNSFLYFLGRGLTITRSNGTLNFIVPNEIMFQIYMTKAREYFLTEKRVVSAVNLGDNVFEDAVVSSAILEIQNSSKNTYSVLMADFRENIDDKYIDSKDLVEVSSDTLKANFNQIYVIGSKKTNLVNRLRNEFPTLESIATTVANGISTSCDKVYIVSGEMVNDHKIENSVAKRTIRGSNFNKYWINENVNDFVLYVTKNTVINEIPNTIAYLKKFKELLIKSSVEKKNEKRDWQILFRARKERDFVSPKILIRQTGDRIIAALDSDTNFYPIDTVNIVKLHSDDMELNLAILGILNSKLITLFYQEISQEGGRILAQVKPIRVKAVPIPDLKNIKRLSKLVAKVIAEKRKDRDAAVLENQVDNLVYQLYDLTQDEIEIVENSQSQTGA